MKKTLILLRIICVIASELLSPPIRLLEYIVYAIMGTYHVMARHITIRDSWEIFIDIEKSRYGKYKIFIKTGKFYYPWK